MTSPKRRYADEREDKLCGSGGTFIFAGLIFMVGGVLRGFYGERWEVYVMAGLWVLCLIGLALINIARAINDERRHDV